MRIVKWVAILGVAFYAAIYFGVIVPGAHVGLPIGDTARQLAAEPALGQAFTDPATARQEALYVVLFLGVAIPIALVLAVILVVFAWKVLLGLGAAMRLPSWLSGMLILGGGAYGGVTLLPLWLPSLRIGLGFLARVWIALVG